MSDIITAVLVLLIFFTFMTIIIKFARDQSKKLNKKKLKGIRELNEKTKGY